jgi:hypothetical protein
VSAAPTFAVDDVGATARWYADNLDFSIFPFPLAEPWVFAILVRDGVELMLQRIEGYRKPDLRRLRPEGQWDAYFRIEGVDELYDAAREREIAMPLTKQRYGDTEFEVLDPNGYVLVFRELKDDQAPVSGA